MFKKGNKPWNTGKTGLIGYWRGKKKPWWSKKMKGNKIALGKKLGPSFRRLKSKSIRSDGYVYIFDDKRGHSHKEHIIKIERKIGRRMIKGEVVHHKNGIKTDNRISNLLLITQSKHLSLHLKGNKYWKLRKSYAS